ncbi:MAG: hypothetical protein ACXWCI_05110 [Caldimonas sp.]
MTHRTPWFLLALAALLMTACGGGGGDDLSPGPYAANTALHRLLVTGGTWNNLAGNANGQPFTATIAFAPGPSGLFPATGTFSAQTIQTVTITAAGASNSVSETIYYVPLAQTDAFIGLQVDGLCSVATSNTAVPTAASIGASGPIFAESDLDGCANASIALGTTANTWSLEADKGIALMCWNLAAHDLGGAASGSESICIEVAADGTLGTHARFSLTAAGLTIIARNF